jgi:hypothetical protein
MHLANTIPEKEQGYFGNVKKVKVCLFHLEIVYS